MTVVIVPDHGAVHALVVYHPDDDILRSEYCSTRGAGELRPDMSKVNPWGGASRDRVMELALRGFRRIYVESFAFAARVRLGEL